MKDTRPPAVIHVDLDGLADVFRAHNWDYSHQDDPVFETGLRSLMAMLDREGLSATMFVIADSLDNPTKRQLLQEAARGGYEIASHSMSHPRWDLLTPEQMRWELSESRLRLEDVLEVEVRGFRAPGYRIDRVSLEMLSDCGYKYDSSVFPSKRLARRLGISDEVIATPSKIFTGSELIEIPLPDHRPLPFPFNPSYALLLGDGYFAHEFGDTWHGYFRWGLSRFRKKGQPLVLLFHLIDLASPVPPDRLDGLKSRLYTLSHLSQKQKLERCQEMLSLAAKWFRMTTTSSLLKGIATGL